VVLNEVVRRVLAVAKPDRIILFGSAATGQMTKESDIDLLIVEPAAENLPAESVAITDAIGDVRFAVDVKIISSERFEATKNIIGGIAYPAHKYGRVLYEAPVGGPRTASTRSRAKWRLLRHRSRRPPGPIRDHLFRGQPSRENPVRTPVPERA
jgi:uncharacterized protein